MYPTSSPQPNRISQNEYEILVREGINAAKDGRRRVAQRLLNRATIANPKDYRPWLWLSATTDDLHEQREYLERALACNPTLDSARKGLARLNEKLETDTPPAQVPRHGIRDSTQPGVESAPDQETDADGDEERYGYDESSSEEYLEAQTEVFECPNCGWRMYFDPEQNHLYCESCGNTITTEEILAADSAEAPMVGVMDSPHAHTWAATQHRVECEKCGAVTVMESVQKSGQCPYCGHNHLVDSKEIRELLDPQVVALYKMKEKEAVKRAREWLNKGLFAPDDLGENAKGLELRPAYYPFWTFDGAIEAKWSCQVREGYDQRNSRWEYRTGVHSEFFDDVLVSGVTALKNKEIASIEPFNLKDVVQFEPGHLAGWPTLSYDRSMSDASLLAREKVMREVRRRMYGMIEPGREKKDVQIGAGNWTGMTYKHVLLPIWVGTYHYKEQEFHVLVNGQTGKVGGIKPKDSVKVVGVWVMALAVLVLLIVLLTWLALTYGGDLVNLLVQ